MSRRRPDPALAHVVAALTTGHALVFRYPVFEAEIAGVKNTYRAAEVLRAVRAGRGTLIVSRGTDEHGQVIKVLAPPDPAKQTVKQMQPSRFFDGETVVET